MNKPPLLIEGEVAGRRLLSGIKPTGRLHLGNYLGAMKQHIELQHANEGFFFIANYHSLTTIHDPDMLRRMTLDVALDYLAAGLDPHKAALYRQSDVPEVQELAWMLACLTGMGDLERAVSFKDKVERGISASVGLFTYPILMAADILIVRGEVVPVGEDQLQHIEMARRFATHFHTVYGRRVFKLPQARVDRAKIVPGVDGQKMSKSYDNTIPLFESRKRTRKRIMGIKTDSRTVEEAKDPDQCTVMALLSHFAADSELEDLKQRYRLGGMGYGETKKRLAELFEETFAPMRERREKLAADTDRVEDILREGSRKARVVAAEVMDEVREACGIVRCRSLLAQNHSAKL